MNILVVSTFPPMVCGIGRYAEQQVRALIEEGHRVDVLSPPEGGGDLQATLFGGWRPLRLLKYLWAYDQAFIHYTPDFFYNKDRAADRIQTSLAFILVMLVLGRRVNFLIHETSYKIDEAPARGKLRHRLDRISFRLARSVIFHSARERDAFARFYRLPVERPQFEIWPHDKYFKKSCEIDRDAARRRFGIEPGVTLLLCIGFIQPHKGFERALNALAAAQAPNLRLKIVGSVRIDWDKARDYAGMLHTLAKQDSRAEVIEGYLSDEMFDAWIQAADYVVIPYHEIWTSGVAARAKLFGKPIIASATGGLAEQLDSRSFLFKDEMELRAIFEKL